ncbi:MAG: UDP-N-acetylmuramoyl-L-alanine--D-glutamate ligase [Proteobacteria bacterium]|nr:MAG: UDP-N-acetylmuramoyl-L-alanine--D-glutamate ligase [Pseudomonadota bacterium]
MKLADLAHKKVAIWGYGVEGRATVAYLRQHLPERPLTVLCPEQHADQDGVTFNHQAVNAALLDDFDVVIKSPGISPYQAAVQDSQTNIISASALWFSNELNRTDKAPTVIAITGTKGKSTACYLLHEALQACGLDSLIAGNFGTPLIACDANCDAIVVETSSYQAQDGAIKADIAVMLNLYSEHLDWHGSDKQYQQDKWRLLQTAHETIVNAEDENSQQQLQENPLSSVIWFNHLSGFYVLNDVLMHQDKALLSTAGWQLSGVHNLHNLAAVMTVLKVMGLDVKPALNAIKKCPPLPHRLQSLGTFDGVRVINDSIASTPHASWAALQTCPAERTVLLLGGYERGVDWLWFAKKIMANPPKKIICSGANGQRISQILLQHDGIIDCEYMPTLAQAVTKACSVVQAGDYLLLSPGAPSFDAFDNYQHRGQQFSQWVQQFLK